ncbi:MAG: YggS family pyridoxal phosphate-dependent enzyme [Lachnospiraceae bacterium]|nr:YggS family pyridoxal phosphate-dependent enzyme [Lachnospiraceae bacterium]
MIAENLKTVEERIRTACLRAGRPRDSVQLIAVSKTKPAEAVAEAYAAGQRLFGENHAQEIVAKAPQLPKDIRWHFIGNLQKNKVKYLVGVADLIHSVNSEAIAAEIEKQAAKRGLIQNVLLEVNVAEEASKQGASLEALGSLLSFCEAQPHLRLCGLMAVAPLTEDPEESRPYFIRLRQLREELAKQLKDPSSFRELSMGMSGDFEVAVEEGATYIRVGTSIFGPRYYSV